MSKAEEIRINSKILKDILDWSVVGTVRRLSKSERIPFELIKV